MCCDERLWHRAFLYQTRFVIAAIHSRLHAIKPKCHDIPHKRDSVLSLTGFIKNTMLSKSLCENGLTVGRPMLSLPSFSRVSESSFLTGSNIFFCEFVMCLDHSFCNKASDKWTEVIIQFRDGTVQRSSNADAQVMLSKKNEKGENLI
ncbi:unnamed protein product [Albugo candida]|uniref:Uncharacterized protein n=1 Tax=Albugo candida TaxID=65357 RepID=A0A024FUP8_9STRA|nr:unnamed protein product [Albugo candida]|eukprot:CCI10850.1 unnamed protein product [Albugo candida]